MEFQRTVIQTLARECSLKIAQIFANASAGRDIIFTFETTEIAAILTHENEHLTIFPIMYDAKKAIEEFFDVIMKEIPDFATASLICRGTEEVVS